jgi:hypothetical protein
VGTLRWTGDQGEAVILVPDIAPGSYVIAMCKLAAGVWGGPDGIIRLELLPGASNQAALIAGGMMLAVALGVALILRRRARGPSKPNVPVNE